MRWEPISAKEAARQEALTIGLKEAGIEKQGTRWDYTFGADIPGRVVAVPIGFGKEFGPYSGLPHVKVRLGRREAWWIVDTGASYTTIEAPDAKRFDVRLLRTNEVEAIGISGIGAEVSARFALLPPAEIGAMSITGQHPLLVLQGMHHERLAGILTRRLPPLRILGGPSLRVAPRLTFDFPAEQLIFALDPVESIPNGAVELPLILREHRTFTRLNVQGSEVECLVDTGMDAELDLPQPLLKEVGALGAGTRVKTRTQGGVGGTRKTEEFKLPSLTLQGRKFSNLRVSSGAAGMNAIGIGFLKQFRVTFDFAGERIFLESPEQKNDETCQSRTVESQEPKAALPK